jgi:hypothetical protein
MAQTEMGKKHSPLKNYAGKILKVSSDTDCLTELHLKTGLRMKGARPNWHASCTIKLRVQRNYYSFIYL